MKDLLIKARDKGRTKVREQNAAGPYEIAFSNEDAALIIDQLSDLFVQIGLKENDEPNPTGLYIEELIDVFNSAG
ncbi:MAG: hypothetical protein M3Y08_11230 [Fibrobacterota bacterium]|nr:hypothetical protein [Fibrobacterota bacterium]